MSLLPHLPLHQSPLALAPPLHQPLLASAPPASAPTCPSLPLAWAPPNPRPSSQSSHQVHPRRPSSWHTDHRRPALPLTPTLQLSLPHRRAPRPAWKLTLTGINPTSATVTVSPSHCRSSPLYLQPLRNHSPSIGVTEPLKHDGMTRAQRYDS